MGNTSWRAGARLQRARRKLTAAVTAGVGLALVVPMLAATPAQAGLLDGVPVVGEVGDLPVIDDTVIEEILTEGETVVGGVVTDASGTVTKIVDTDTGAVTSPSGDLLGVLDPITGALLLPPLPGIEPGGTGGDLLVLVDGVLVTLCDSADAACEQVPLDDMTDEAAVILKAVPTTPGDIPMWDPETCPAIIADICMISVDDLTGDTPLAPIVAFLPGGSSGSDAPDTTITSAVPGKQKTSHTFAFEADPVTEETRFECKLEVAYKSTPPTGAQRSHDWQPCGADPVGSHSYKSLANGTYVFAVQAVDGPVDDPAADETPATQSWSVAIPPEVPETSIVSGPRYNSWVFTRQATFRFRSTVEGSEFQCWYDGMTNACDSGSFTWASSLLKPGTHVFKVAALANKTQDFSPAGRTFNVPFDDRAMVGKSWTRAKAKKHFKNTVTTTTARGAALTTRQKVKFRRVVLVADKGPGFGTVKVFWGKKMLREVDLQAKRLRNRRVIPIKRFSGPLRSGKLRVVVVSSGKTVRIDGIGAAKR